MNFFTPPPQINKYLGGGGLGIELTFCWFLPTLDLSKLTKEVFMKGFKLSEFCEREGMDFKKSSLLLDEAQDHLMNIMFSRVKAENELMINSACEQVAERIISAINSRKTSSGKKTSKGNFYAPCRERFICHAEKSRPNMDGTMTMVFESLTPRPYGNKDEGITFTHEKIVSQGEFISLFYDVDLKNPGSSSSGYKARPDVIKNFPILAEPYALASNVFGYLYDVEVKRILADYREPVEVLSITPCGVMQNANNQL